MTTMRVIFRYNSNFLCSKPKKKRFEEAFALEKFYLNFSSALLICVSETPD